MNYVIAPTGADIMHFGKGHDDNPPGRGSGRYAWGSGGSSSNSSKTKKRQSLISKYKSAKQQKANQKANKKRLEALEARQKALADKERIVKSGTPREVDLIKSELTDKERENILKRLEFESKLSSYTQAEIDSGWKAANDAMKKVGMMTNWGKQAVDILKVFSSAAYELDNFGKGNKGKQDQDQGKQNKGKQDQDQGKQNQGKQNQGKQK